MKCNSRTEYDCCFLSKSNIEEFVEWFEYNVNEIYDYNVSDKFLNISIAPYDKNFDEDLDSFILDYNRWYMTKNGQLFDYDPEYFLKHYTLILVD